MNRNTNSRFTMNPSVKIQRSRMEDDPEFKASFNIGRLYPLGNPWEVVPGDTFDVDTSCAVRMQPLVSSPMDNLHMDVYFFFVPMRLTWSHTREFFGENTQGAWYPQTQYNQPLMTFTKFAPQKSIADYMGLPVYDASKHEGTPVKAYSVSRLKFNAYCSIWNEWFRDENLQDPVFINLNDNDILSQTYGSVTPDNPYMTKYKEYAHTGFTLCLPVAKSHDLFTSALPQPQKGEEIDLFNRAHVYFGAEPISTAEDMIEKYGAQYIEFTKTGEDLYDRVSLYDNANSTGAGAGQPTNMLVDAGFTVNELRTAFAMQRLLEKEAMYGSRYTEIIRGHFGVTPADASLQRPQYLGGFRKSLMTNQILQTSETGNTPQGNVAGYSLTSVGHDGHWIHSFDEFGWVVPLVCFRIDQHSYQQGIDKSWMRRSKYDVYFPTFANLGNMPIENTELYTTGFDYSNSKLKDDFVTGVDHEVFGYQEAWYDYRTFKNSIAGEMRSNVTNSLDSWHFADDYDSLPSLSDEWIRETPGNVDRALSVQSSVSDQLFGDFKFHIKMTRPMPLYSVPGLIDHN